MADADLSLSSKLVRNNKDMKDNILVIDDEKSIRLAIALLLKERYEVVTADCGAQGLECLDDNIFSAVILDIGLPDCNGIDILKSIKEHHSDLPVIMLTAFGDTKTVVEAIKAGAYDYQVKPVQSHDLEITLQNAIEVQGLKSKIRSVLKPQVEQYRHGMVFQNAALKRKMETAFKAAVSVETPILITGESGTGKGALAKAIHYSRNDLPGPFVTVNCGAISKELVESELFGYDKGAFTGARAEGKPGRFEEASDGTLLLDEIGNMPLDTQAKLLQVVEERAFYRVGANRPVPVKSRILAATNLDLDQAVKDGRFRSDLYYRLNVIKIDVPPLRDRQEDILPLAEHFIALFNDKFAKHFNSISREAREALLAYSWPGNVRELRNQIERITLLEDGPEILSRHLNMDNGANRSSTAILRTDAQLRANVRPYDDVVQDLIQAALKQAKGNVNEGARLLGIAPHKLRYRIQKYGIRF